MLAAAAERTAAVEAAEARVAAVTEAAKLAEAANAQALHREQLSGLGLVRVRVS